MIGAGSRYTVLGLELLVAALTALLGSGARADLFVSSQNYDSASPEEKDEQEKTIGLTGTELVRLTGKGFLKTKRFQSKYHELPDSKLEKVEVQGDSATLYYLEPDGDQEKAILVRQEGKWKVWLTMPTVSKP